MTEESKHDLCWMIHDPIRSDFKDPILGSENRKQVFRGSDFKVPFLW